MTSPTRRPTCLGSVIARAAAARAPARAARPRPCRAGRKRSQKSISNRSWAICAAPRSPDLLVLGDRLLQLLAIRADDIEDERVVHRAGEPLGGAPLLQLGLQHAHGVGGLRVLVLDGLGERIAELLLDSHARHPTIPAGSCAVRARVVTSSTCVSLARSRSSPLALASPAGAAEFTLPPGFSAQLYVTGEGFSSDSWRGLPGIPPPPRSRWMPTASSTSRAAGAATRAARPSTCPVSTASRRAARASRRSRTSAIRSAHRCRIRRWARYGAGASCC